jgi:hypothetical protein
MTDSTCTPNNPENQEEVWKDIPGYPRYQVSNMGRVRSFLSGKENILTAYIRKGGYGVVNLKNCNGRKMFQIHRLVLYTFVGECPIDQECCHKNGVPHDNRLENLRWGTKSSNAQDRKLHGTFHEGEANYSSKITNSDAEDIRNKYAKGSPVSTLVKEYGVQQNAIRKIITGKSFKNVGGLIHTSINCPSKGYCGSPGEKNPNAQLKDADIPKIHKLLYEKVNVVDIAKKFNVSVHVINFIRTGKSWKHINNPYTSKFHLSNCQSSE